MDKKQTKKTFKTVKYGKLMADVPVEIYYDNNWKPVLTAESLKDIDETRNALNSGDFSAIGNRIKLYRLFEIRTPAYNEAL